MAAPIGPSLPLLCWEHSNLVGLVVLPDAVQDSRQKPATGQKLEALALQGVPEDAVAAAPAHGKQLHYSCRALTCLGSA